LHYFLLISTFFFALTDLNAQGSYNTTDWRFSNPRPFGFTVLDVEFGDNNKVIAVGTDGGIARSTDGGATWTYGAFTFTGPTGVLARGSFQDVHFVSPTVAYAVGSAGCMAKTTDGGATWSFVQTPLFNRQRNINSVWFINENTGYIGGQHNTPDSLPKLYFTTNGGASWDSLSAPMGGKSRIGYINNPNLPPVITDVTAKDKEILRIKFINDTVGYISGSGSSTFERFQASSSPTASPACSPLTTTSSSGAHHASLLWKFSSGNLTDYSTSKERLGYIGINATTITCQTAYQAPQNATQSMRAMSILDDTTVLLMSFNNNIVLKVRTGVNDSTENLAVPGLFEKGKYETLNFPFPPLNATPIPSPQVLNASNPYNIVKASNGKLFANSGSSAFDPRNRMWTSIDSGRNWIEERNLPTGQNFSQFTTNAIAIAPNGKYLAMGNNGVFADSIPGDVWKTTYTTSPITAAHSKIEFTDCNNGIAAGASNISVTEDGGLTWIDKRRADFAASNWSINGMVYQSLTKSYFAVTNGVVYFSSDKGTTLDPLYSNNNFQMQDVAAIGDSIWVVGSTTTNTAIVPTGSRTSNIFYSYDAGATWSTYTAFPIGGTTFQTLTEIEFPTRMVGYAAGNRDTIYKTTDGGATWFKLPLPTPGVTPQITYNDMYALDENTVFLTGNGFPRKVVFRTTDGGNTWQDITNNILTAPGGNLSGVMMHDVNNGYVLSNGGIMYKTTNGGTSWSVEISPTNQIFQAAAFAPRNVPNITSLENRKLFVIGFGVPQANGNIMEYGTLANVQLASTETIVNANCVTPSGGSITISTTGGIAPFQYSFNGGTFQSSNIFNNLAQGSYTIVVKDDACQSITKTIDVDFDDNLTLTVTPVTTTVCAGTPVQLVATSNAAVFNWSPATGLSATNISNPVATPSVTTTYMVTATLNGCSKTETLTITVNPRPTVTASANTAICIGNNTTLTASGAVTYSWTPATGLNTTTGASVVASPAATTTYTVTGTNANGCTNTANVTVTVNAFPVLTVSPAATICLGSNTTLTASGATTYSWTPSAGLNNTTGASVSASPNATTTYTVTGTSNGCSRTATVIVNVNPVPQVNAGPDKTILIGEAVGLTGTTNVVPQSVAWTPAGTLTGANTLTPVARPQATTTYTLTVTDSRNCAASDNAVVTVIPYCVKAMEAFSPNGDGINDRWMVTAGTSCTNQIAVKVYNRYGGLVYNNDNYQNNWDGTYNGKAAADGTYYFVAIYTLINGKQVTINGNVTILR
jgi:gliding motility-associated-like protein